jgi:hypothetical protein
VAWGAQPLEVRPVPELARIAAVSLDVIHVDRRFNAASSRTQPAQGLGPEHSLT